MNEQNNQVENLATEMLRELKATSKRWFIAFIVTLVLWFATIGIFIYYISLPVDEVITNQSIDDINNSDIVQKIGDEYYGESTTDSDTQEESDEES